MMELPKIPVIVITGFLGSGKTTLLNRLLADGMKTAVVINEFGATAIDQDLLLNQDIPMTVLSGGCLCCQIKGTLAPTLKNLWMAWNKAETKPFERVIIETSGVASPEPILDTLLREPWLSKRYRLHNVVATLAIPNALEQLHNFAEARAQLAWADQILLTQADLAAVGRTEEVYKQLQLIAPASPYRIVNWEFLTSAEILGVAVPVFRRLPTMQSLVEHDFRSLSLYLDHPPTWPKLHTILQDLLQRYTPGLVRIKGVVFVPDQEQPLAIHAVGGHLFPPTCLQFRTNDDRRSRLVFIADSNIDKLSNALPAALYGHEHSIRLH
jgi:G3E family GTPase